MKFISIEPSDPNITEHYCCTHLIFKRNDKAFMGVTHALSALTIFLILVAIFPDKFFSLLGTVSAVILTLACINVIGASLLNDADNTASTFKSTLGITGEILSAIFRTTSVIIQTTIRTKRDDSNPNPHRGFYHTVPAALLIGLVTFLLASSNFFNMNIPYLGEFTSGKLFALVISWLNLHLALAALAKDTMKKVKRNGALGELLSFIISFIVMGYLFAQIPQSEGFQWIGVSVALGMLIHTFGDCFTTAGSPVLFPIKYKGKLWWTVRFLPIKAGGVVEKNIFVPFFALSSVAAIAIIYFRIFN